MGLYRYCEEWASFPVPVDSLNTYMEKTSLRPKDHKLYLSGYINWPTHRTDQKFATVQSENDTLKLKIQQIEDHGRRFNICVFGISDGLEQGNPTSFMNSLLSEVNGSSQPSLPEWQSSQRTQFFLYVYILAISVIASQNWFKIKHQSGTYQKTVIKRKYCQMSVQTLLNVFPK